MRRLIPVIFVLFAFLIENPLRAQSFTELLAKSEQVKAQYGETDDRYLDALSNAIQAAYGEEKNEEANKYRLIHAEIVKGKYGENSLEYAEDLWRLGNVSDYKGDEYTFDCYKRAQKILESIDARDSFIYCNLFWNYFWHYWEEQKWLLATANLQKYIDYAKPWVNKEWKGNVLGPSSIANAYYFLGLTYYARLKNYASALDAFQKGATLLQENNIEDEFPLIQELYQGLWLSYEQLGRYKESIPWHLRSIAAAERIKGDTSDDYLQELSSLRYCYFALNDFDSTEMVNLALLAQIEKRDAQDNISTWLDSLFVSENEFLVDLCVMYKKYPEVIKYGTMLSDIYIKRGEENSDSYLSLLDNLILAYHNTNNYVGAYSLYDKFEYLSETYNRKKTEDYWHYLSLKTEALTYLYKTEELDKVIQEWGRLTSELFGNNSRQSLLYSYQVANQQESLDRHDNAKAGIDNCYRIIRSGECPFESTVDSLLIMASIHNLEGMAYMASDKQRAENSLLLAIEENRQIGRNDCAPILNMGLLCSQQNRDFKKAVDYFDEARQMLESIGDNYSVQYITVLNDLALCYHNLGFNSYSIAIFDLASQTVLANYGKHHLLYGATEQNKSLFYTDISNYEEAINCCNEALECYRQVFGENSEKFGMCLQNLGLMYQYVGNYTKSKDILLSAIPILESINSPYAIYAYTNLLTVYAVEKDGDKLATTAEKAEANLKKNNWEETDVAASLYGSIGYAMLINGISDAKSYLGYALNLLNKVGGKGSIQYHNGLLFFGLASFLDQSQSEDIIPALIDSYKSQYLTNAAFFNSDERESLIAGPRFSQTQNLIFSSRHEGKQDTSLYDFLLFNKGLLLGTSIRYAKAVYNSGNDEIISLYEQLLNLNRFINGEIQKEEDGLTKDTAKAQASSIERGITLYLRQNGGYTEGLNYKYDDVRNSLGNTDIAVEFVSYHNYVDSTTCYAAMVAKKEWDTPRYIDLCKKGDLEKLASLSPDKLYGESTISETAYNLIWEPLTPYLSNIRTVYFSPAGYLNQLAIEHLYNGEKRFDELYDVVRLTSTRELCENKTQYKYATAVLYGGLQYDEDDATMIAESRNIRGNQPVKVEVFRGINGSTTRKGWEYLPGTLEEVNQISSIISKAKINCDVYTLGKGNEESFKALSGNNFGILHIATHGFYMTESQAKKNDFFASNPFASQNSNAGLSPLQRSGLLLSGGNKAWKGEAIPEGVEDGILSAAEIASLDLNSCDVVVLSACETGLGEITDEGVFGLQRAFKNAGVNTIIMSLWEVDDQATSLMMQTFYRNLVRGRSKRESFTAAQSEVRKKYTDPRYWAAFIMLD